MTAPSPDGVKLTASDGGWLRVHPASPFVRGWVALVAIAFFVGRDFFERLLQGRAVLDDEMAQRAPWLLIIGGGILFLAVLGFVLSWYFTRYQVADGYVRVASGIFSRQQRQARLDRVQAIDVLQPLVARIFGLAELKFEVADSGESAVHLAYLKKADAQKLRATILARAAGIVPDPGMPEDTVPEAPEHHILRIRPGRLLGSLLLSEQTVGILLGAVGAVVLSSLTENLSFYVYLFPAALGLAASFWGSFNKGYNFTAAISPDGIRLRYGLLDTQAQTVPPGRVQAVRIHQAPLWRIFGWYRMHINVAGYGNAADANATSSRTLLLPVGTFDDVLSMMALVLPDPGTDNPVDVFAAGINGMDSDGGFVTSPRRVRPISPLGWRRNAYAVTSTALLLRSGRWWRSLAVVPHQRTQSMALQQGPLARRFGVLDLVLHTTPGPVSARLYQADVRVAQMLFTEQSARAREARRSQTSEQWLAQVVARPGSPISQAEAQALTAAHGQASVPDPLPETGLVPAPTSTPLQEEDQRHV